MKNINVKIFVIAYIAVLMLPAVFTFVKMDSANTENRRLAEFPKVMTEEGINRQFFSGLSDYVSDHIGLRSFMINCNTFIHTRLFMDSPEEAVVLGQDGWLYYSDTVNDYMNIATLSEKNADNVGRTVKMLQDYAEEQGIKFVMTIAPDKATLYGEHMPYYYAVTDNNGNLELVEKALAENGVHYADIRLVFETETNGEVLYQRTDSHWNYKGALVGYKTIMNSLGMDSSRFDYVTFTEKADWDGDLATMIYSNLAEKDVQLYPDYKFKYEYTSHEKAVDSLKLVTYCEEGHENAVIYRDSFFNTLQVYFAEAFENVTFSRAYPYNTGLFTDNDTDVVVLEIVERNLVNLAKKAPVMAAPRVQEYDATENGISLTVINESGDISYPEYELHQDEVSGYIHYYGYIDGEFDGDIVVSVDGKAYKAFPIYEQELLGEEKLKDNGFSLYVAQ